MTVRRCDGISNTSGLAAGAVQGERRNYYLLSVMDVYTRKILDWVFQGSIRQADLINLLRRINQIYELKGVILRNDNGSHRDAGAFYRSFSAQFFKKLGGEAGIYSRGHTRGKFLH